MITANALTRAAGIAAVAAGVLFIGVQIGHPQLNATTITTTNVYIRDQLKVLMAVLALDRHHRHVPEPGPPERTARTLSATRLSGRGLPPHPVRRLRRRLRDARDRRVQIPVTSDDVIASRHRPRQTPRATSGRMAHPDPAAEASPTWRVASSSASRSTGHTSSHAGRPRSWQSAGCSAWFSP